MHTNSYTGPGLKTAKDKLREYFEPQKNRRYEVFKFRQAKQESNETLDQFHTRLRVLAQTCSFNDADFEIEQQIIINGISSRIRKKALREPDYDLKQILLDDRLAEQSEFQARDIDSKDEKSDNIQQVREKTDMPLLRGNISTQRPVPSKREIMSKMRQIESFRESLSWQATTGVEIPIHETPAQATAEQKADPSNTPLTVNTPS
jgi:hypothetical protein